MRNKKYNLAVKEIKHSNAVLKVVGFYRCGDATLNILIDYIHWKTINNIDYQHVDDVKAVAYYS